MTEGTEEMTEQEQKTYRVDVTVILHVEAPSKAQATRQAEKLVCDRMMRDQCVVEWTGVVEIDR